MEVLNDILGYKNRKIFQDTDCFSFSLDSIMLANFATIRLKDKRIVDLGCGNGVIPLIMSLRCDKKIIGVELQSKIADMAKRSIEYNGLTDTIEIINCNMKDYVSDETFESFDLITCNPPYFKVNDKNYFNDNIEPKRVRFVHEKSNKESTLVLIEGQKNGKVGLKVENPFILYNEDGSETEEYKKLLVEVK